MVGPDGESLAGPGSPAALEVDLVTVLEHELGHVLGLPDNDEAGDLMDVTLGLGVERVPASADLATIASTPTTAARGQFAPLVTSGLPSANSTSPATPNRPGDTNASAFLAESNFALYGLPAAPIDLAAPALSGDQAGHSNFPNQGTPRVSAPLPAGDQRPRQSVPANGPMTQAMVDAALASMLGSAGGNGENHDLTFGHRSPGTSSARDSSFAVTSRDKIRVPRPAISHPQGVLSSQFSTKIRRPGQSATSRIKDSVNEQLN